VFNHIAELLQFDAKAEVATAQGLEKQLAVVKQMRCGMKMGEAVDTEAWNSEFSCKELVKVSQNWNVTCGKITSSPLRLSQNDFCL